MNVIGTQDGTTGHYLKGFGQDNEGELYFLVSEQAGPSGSSGKVFRMVEEAF